MPTSIPKVEEMLKFASERSGKEIGEIKKEVQGYGKQFANVVRTERLMTYLYLKNVLGMTPKIALPTEGKLMTIEEMQKTPATSKISTQGVVIRSWEYKAGKDQKKAFGFILCDETSTMRGDCFWEGAKTWEEAKVKTMDFITISNCGINEYKGAKKIRITGRTQIEVNAKKKAKYDLSKFVTKISEIGKSSMELIQVSFLTMEESPYVACPYCTKSLKDVEEGQRTKCPKCGMVTAERVKWIKGLASDGEDDLDISIPPRLVKQIGMQINPSGLYLFSGRYQPKRKEFMVDALLSHVGGEEGKAVKQRFSTGKPKKEEVKRRILLFLESYKGLKQDELFQNLKSYLNAEEETVTQATEELMKAKKITCEEGVYKVAS